ncbi:MAG: DNA topoisomerase I [archaeon]
MQRRKIEQLIHNGVLFPKYDPKGFSISYKGNLLKLSLETEEMAVSWVRKQGTEYVQDPVFVKNFMKDFCRALNLPNPSQIENLNFSQIQEWVQTEKEHRERLSKEEKKTIAAERKMIREANKAKYGYALVNGDKVELGNYMVEPPSIFMGRGKHPLRGRWKGKVSSQDVVLNLSPDAPVPTPSDGGKWKQIVFNPDFLWIAKWDDKLRGVEKYVWFSDTAVVKQEREIEKFEKASEFDDKIDQVRKHIIETLTSRDPSRKKIATVCYLIDELKMRVGDEKDSDEADTVGATTLRAEHVKILDDGRVRFDFLGKDSVRWIQTITPQSAVLDNLRECIGTKRRALLFEGVRSDKVNEFFNEIMPGLTAKVFRTYHASKAVKEYLGGAKVKKEDDKLQKKMTATMANLQAAIVCNHKRKLPKNWEESLAKKEERLKELRSKGRAKQVKELSKRIQMMKETRDYNLGTSLRSYIDPRVYAEWGRRVDFDWKDYYPKTLQRKFVWVENQRT